MNWFNSGIFVFSGLAHEIIRSPTVKRLNKYSLFNSDINDFINQLNLGFDKLKIDPKNQEVVLTHHNKYDNVGNIIGDHWFDLETQESSGTNKIFDIAAIFLAALFLGHTTIIDELDAKLHPLLTLSIVKLFHSPVHNPLNAQLIFATHDTNLLSCGCFRRDQIYFTEKNKFEETDLYSLVEYKDPNGLKTRNDRSFEKDYINGRYGAIPFIGDFSNLLRNGQSSKD
ncbi:MAG: ATP-binding protein [Mucilaginibacter sp.]|nr:ATP-binding protein [Mucilaginibacter sp.]